MCLSKLPLHTAICIWICLLFGIVHLFVPGSNYKNIAQETEVSLLIVDETTLKQKEMRDPTVSIQTHQLSGSGTIIDCLETITDGLFEYCVLTNAHVIHSRFEITSRSVDSFTDKVQTETIDNGCSVITFDHIKREWFKHDTTVIAEDIQYDLALLSFRTEQKLAIAELADSCMLKQVRVFDEIFIIGCQLGSTPSPTTGIISQIIMGNNGEKEWVIYGSTAQITPGSSGGGLFKRYNNHYYIIGIPFRVDITSNGQIIPHLSYAISVGVAKDFIDQNMVSHP